jgi:hypothetical protein
MRKDEEHAEPVMRHEADVPRVLATTSKRSAVARATVDSVSLSCMALLARDVLYEKEPSGRQTRNFLPAFSIHAPSDLDGR